MSDLPNIVLLMMTYNIVFITAAAGSQTQRWQASTTHCIVGPVTDDDQRQQHPWERHFIERMPTLREAKEMTQTDLARVLSERHGLRFHQQIVARIEAGERPLRLNEAALIAQELDTDLLTMMSDPGTPESARLNRQLAQQRLAATTAELVVHLSDGIEEFEHLCQELESAWTANVSAQKGVGVTPRHKLVHKGLAHTLRQFESRFKTTRDKVASIVEGV
jgi:transcriptional regulator with XRE-family HTH domain